MDSTTINILASNPWIILGGFLTGLLGVVLAVVFYFKSRKDRIPCYEIYSNTLIEGVDKALDGLQIQYKGQTQSRVTVTKVVLWNDGRETIDKNDLVVANPIKVLCPPGIDILDIQVIQVSSASNAVSLGDAIRLDKHISYPIDFEYLDHKDYFVIQIVNNGDESHQFSIDGKIKGVAKIVQVSGTRLDAQFLRIFPFMRTMEKLLASRYFMKYAGSTSYLIFASAGTWELTQGKNEWYMWAVTLFCYFAAAVIYFGIRRISPVNI